MVCHYLYLYTMVKSKSNLIPGINSEAKPKIIKQVSFEGQNLKIYTKMQNNFLHSFRFVSGVSYRWNWGINLLKKSSIMERDYEKY